MKRNLPAAPQVNAPHAGLQSDLLPSALERWTPGLRAAAQDEGSISMFDVIGSDPWTGEGVTAKRISAALRSIGPGKPVVVNLNSPGGDMFEGLAIYNLLREHDGEVTIKVLGMAASAASIIAMAGDNIQVARSGFLMIHNSWSVAMGNRHDFRAFADMLEPFDAAMADIYAARTGMKRDAIAKMMDSETWLNGSMAVEQGFANSLLDSDEIASDDSSKNIAYAARKLELMLAKSGMTRRERRKLMSEFKGGTPSAAVDEAGERDAAGNESVPTAALVDEVLNLSRSLKGILS